MIDFFVKGGALMWPILLCSIVGLALVIIKALQFRSIIRQLPSCPGGPPERCPAVIAPIAGCIEKGLDEGKVAFAGTKQVRELEKGLGALSLITVIAPLLGFTGTVTGMIGAFMTIASHTGGRVEPAMVAGGIYEALITTAGGLFVAIPGHVALHFLEGRLDEIAFRMKEAAMALMERRGDGV